MAEQVRGAISWEMTPEERERADGALAALETARQLRAGADSLAASAQAVLDGIAEAQARRIPSTGDARDLPYRSMAEEVASAMRVSRHVASARLRESSDLARSYPATQQALREGAISEEHVRAILAEGSALAAGDAARFAYECECLDVAWVSTAPQTRTAARVIADRLLDRDVEQAHAQAKARRRVSVRDLGDGMSELYAVAESTVIRGALDRLTTMGRRVAHAHRTAHHREQATAAGAPAETTRRFSMDPSRRTLDQIRADLFIDLLLTGEPNAHQLHTPGDTALGEIRAAVQVMIPVGLMTGESTGRPRGRPLLESDQPIGAAEARRLAARTPTWDRIFVAPDGQVIATDSYRPTREQRRFLLARDGTCRFPGCTAKAKACDIDHTLDYAHGGETSLDNLGCLCRSHHLLKHNSPWRVRQVGDGVYEWTSPMGSGRTTTPGSAVRFRDLSATAAPF